MSDFTVASGYASGIEKGGCIYLKDASTSISNCCFTGGSAYQGGGIYYDNCPDQAVSNCIFNDNDAGSIGGGALCYRTGTDFSGCEFTGNSAQTGGGLYYTGDSVSSVAECEFSGNIASSGGGLAVQSADSVVTNSSFTGNSARYGGAFYAFNNSNVILGGSAGSGNHFTDNFAWAGADLYSTDDVDVSYSTFAGYYPSDYYVHPFDNFDFTGCTAELTPVTQDVYVSPAGDDDNDGLSWANAFKTIQHALSVVYGTETDPVAVYLDEGVYSPSLTAEEYPLPLVNHVSIIGSSKDDCVLDAESTDPVIAGYDDGDAQISGLTVTHGNTGFWLTKCSIFITSCRILDNSAEFQGGGFYFLGYSDTTISDCIIEDNHAVNGAGFYCQSSASPLIVNSLIINNEADSYGAGAYCNSMSRPDFQNCLFIGNTAGLFGGALYNRDSRFGPSIINSILWNDSPEEIKDLYTGNTTVEYSDVQQPSGTYPGTGNINADPLLVQGPEGDYYLSCTAAGQSQNSPCLDAGSDAASNVCFETQTGAVCMDQLTTRTDQITDSGIVDMGFHYQYLEPTPTPTATVTQSPTLSPTLTSTTVPTDTPTETPTFSPTPVPTETPTNIPTNSPTDVPTATLTPTNTPTETPTSVPTNTPTLIPTSRPTTAPTNVPTLSPTETPTMTPSLTPTVTAEITPAPVPSLHPAGLGCAVFLMSLFLIFKKRR